MWGSRNSRPGRGRGSGVGLSGGGGGGGGGGSSAAIVIHKDKCEDEETPPPEPSFWMKLTLLIQFAFYVSICFIIISGVIFLAYSRGKKDAVPVNIICAKLDRLDAGKTAGDPIQTGVLVWPKDGSEPALGAGQPPKERGPLKIIVHCGPGGALFPGDAREGRDGSQYYRQSPGASAVRPRAAASLPGGLAAESQDGLPSSCTGADQGDCINRWKMLSCADRAQYWLKLGEAEVAIGRVEQAKKYFNEALRVGRACDTEYAGIAQKRLAAINLTCEYTPESLARISRGIDQAGAGGIAGGAPIDLRVRQQALKALGHYDGKIDGTYGASTRAAVQAFQREYGFSETGDLDPIETVYLVCAAAQNASDLVSINVLGLMYVTGLGVVQSTDIGMRWLKTAATRGNADALYNLALIYGTGVVLSSYRLCEIVESYDVADSYLRDAAEKKHAVALYLMQKYGALSTESRWRSIRNELMDRITFYRLRMENVGRGCEPN